MAMIINVKSIMVGNRDFNQRIRRKGKGAGNIWANNA